MTNMLQNNRRLVIQITWIALRP